MYIIYVRLYDKFASLVIFLTCIYINIMETILEVRLPDYRCSSDKRANIERSKRSLNSMWFQMFCCSGRLKSMLAKAVGAERCGRMREKKLHAAAGGEAHVEVKIPEKLRLRALLEVEKVHAAVHMEVKMLKTLQLQSTFGR